MHLLPFHGTDVSVSVVISQGPGNTDPGAPAQGVVAADISSAYYARGTSAPVVVSLSDLSADTDTHADGGFIQRANSSGAGVYRVDLPDTALDALGPGYFWCNFAAASLYRMRALAYQVSALAQAERGMPIGQVIAGTLTTSQFSFQLISGNPGVANVYNDRHLVFLGDAGDYNIVHAAKKITAVDIASSPKLISCDPLPAAPAADQVFVIV